MPDELYAVREEIRKLEERETVLRNLLLDNADLRTGASYLAWIKTIKVPRTDLKELRAAHPELVDEYTYPLEQTRVVLMGITSDGEIINPKRFSRDSV